MCRGAVQRSPRHVTRHSGSMEVEVIAGQWPDDLERLLGDLPEWFGIEASVADYVKSARTLPSLAATRNGEVVGVTKRSGSSRSRSASDIWDAENPCLIIVKPLG